MNVCVGTSHKRIEYKYVVENVVNVHFCLISIFDYSGFRIQRSVFNVHDWAKLCEYLFLFFGQLVGIFGLWQMKNPPSSIIQNLHIIHMKCWYNWRISIRNWNKIFISFRFVNILFIYMLNKWVVSLHLWSISTSIPRCIIWNSNGSCLIIYVA